MKKMDLKTEDSEIIYTNLDSNKDGVVSIDEILKITSENPHTKNFFEKLNENLLPTCEVISTKLKKLKKKLSNDKESQEDIDW